MLNDRSDNKLTDAEYKLYYSIYGDYIESIARKLCNRDEQVASELSQAAYIALWERGASAERAQDKDAWLKSLLYRAMLTRLRPENKQERIKKRYACFAGISYP